jgi:hypothetical protein
VLLQLGKDTGDLAHGLLHRIVGLRQILAAGCQNRDGKRINRLAVWIMPELERDQT